MSNPFYAILLSVLLYCPITAFAHNSNDLSEPSYDPMMHTHMFSLPIMIGFDGMVMYGIAYDHHSMGGMTGGMESGNMDGTHDASGMLHAGMNQGIAWHFMPMVSFGGDKLKKIIKLGYQLCDESGCGDGYKLTRSSHIDLGAGMMLMGLMSTHWFVHAGVMPIVGGDYYMEMHVNSYEKAKSKQKLRIPTSLSDLENWSEGDKLSYSTRGGVMSSTGVGFTIFCQASVMYMYQNIRKVKYEKISESLLKVDIVRDHKNAAGFLAGTPITFAMAHTMQNKQRVNSLVFDFRQDSAIEKFRDFLSGKLNIKTAQTLLPGVSAMHKAKAKSGGSMGNALARVPFLYQKERDTMKSHTKSQTQEFLPESQNNGLSYTAMKASSTNTRGILSHHKRDHTMFMSMVTELREPYSHFMGSFKWFYENDHAHIVRFKNRITKMGDLYGLTIPSLNYIDFQKRGYVRAEIDIAFNFLALDKSLQNIHEHTPFETSHSLRTDIEQFFISDANPSRVCSHKHNCLNKIIAVTNNSVDKIFATANKIEFYRINDKKTKLSKAISELGMLISKNRFILHYFTNKLEDAQATLSLKGEFFEPYRLNLEAEE